jgi:hypothetical protein
MRICCKRTKIYRVPVDEQVILEEAGVTVKEWQLMQNVEMVKIRGKYKDERKLNITVDGWLVIKNGFRSKKYKVNDIKLIKIGNIGNVDFDYYRTKFKSDQCFYIDFKNAELKRQSFVAPDAPTCRTVVDIIEKITDTINNMSREEKNELWFAKQFDQFDRDGNKAIDEKELKRLFDALGVSKDALGQFKKQNKQKRFTYDETKALYGQLTISKWIKTLFERLAGKADSIDIDAFHAFVKSQGERWSKEEIIEKTGKLIDLSAFSHYLRHCGVITELIKFKIIIIR